jgi:hypothetical protein
VKRAQNVILLVLAAAIAAGCGGETKDGTDSTPDSGELKLRPLGSPPDVDEILLVDDTKSRARARKSMYRIELTVPFDNDQTWTDLKAAMLGGNYTAARTLVQNKITADGNWIGKVPGVVEGAFLATGNDVDIDYELLEDWVHNSAGGVTLHPKLRFELNSEIASGDLATIQSAMGQTVESERQKRACIAHKHLQTNKKNAGAKRMIEAVTGINPDNVPENTFCP